MTIDGKLVYRISIDKPMTIDGVHVIAAYQNPADASYRNLFWENLPTSDFLYHVYTPPIVSINYKYSNIMTPTSPLYWDTKIFHKSNNCKLPQHTFYFNTNAEMLNIFFQVTVPRYRANPHIIPFSMLCPGVSQNIKHHHLTLYKGQVIREKSYPELCDENILNILFRKAKKGTELYKLEKIEQNGELYVPPTPGIGFKIGDTKIPYNSEILQSFAELNRITDLSFHIRDVSLDYSLSKVNKTYQIEISSLQCNPDYHMQCDPPHSHLPWYIWTKEGLKIEIPLESNSNDMVSLQMLDLRGLRSIFITFEFSIDR